MVSAEVKPKRMNAVHAVVTVLIGLTVNVTVKVLYLMFVVFVVVTEFLQVG